MGKYNRMWYSFRFNMIRNSRKRAEYAKRKEVFGYVGENVSIMLKKVPLYPELIKLHNNVRVGSGVQFITHDNIHYMLNNIAESYDFTEKIGCIEIRDNVFIGSNSIIMPNINVGENSIIAAGSVVIKNVPKNSVVGGNPAKVIMNFNDFLNKRISENNYYPRDLKPEKQNLSQELIDLMWKNFSEKCNDNIKKIRI